MAGDISHCANMVYTACGLVGWSKLHVVLLVAGKHFTALAGCFFQAVKTWLQASTGSQ